MFLKSIGIKKFRKFEDLVEVSFATTNRSTEFNKVSNDDTKTSIATDTTLLIGKNNVGKSTILIALNKLINNPKSFNVNDFNYQYLIKELKNYLMQIIKNEKKEYFNPFLEFKITIGIDDYEKDTLTNIYRFVNLKEFENVSLINDETKNTDQAVSRDGVSNTIEEVKIYAKYEVTELQIFNEAILELINNIVEVNQIKIQEYKDDDEKLSNLLFKIINENFLEILEIINSDENRFTLNFYRKDPLISKLINVPNFKLNSLINLEDYELDNPAFEKRLSSAYNQIINYNYKNSENMDLQTKIKKSVSNINKTIDQEVGGEFSKPLRKVIHDLADSQNIDINLTGGLTDNHIFNNLIRYSFREDNLIIPENQFGQGYANLMMIIAKILEFIDKYDEKNINNKISLLTIEEPEVNMHPQMQEVFIKNINDAVNNLLREKDKNINIQLIITTHSSHILNSKIEVGKTFNDINYITYNYQTNSIYSVFLNDDKVKFIPTQNSSEDTPIQTLEFLQKHIKYETSDLFFADGIILVEGDVEKTLIKFYLDNHEELKKKYITVFQIDGRHAHYYKNLLNELTIPSVIITDLDITRDSSEKDSFTQINTTNIDSYKTDSPTLKYFFETGELSEICKDTRGEKYEENIFIVTQGSAIEGVYATSFEEAFILTNFNNEIVNKVLERILPKIYKKIVGNDENNNISNSYKWQQKIGSNSKKTEFSNNILLELIDEDKDNWPDMPDYILAAFNFLEDKLGG